MKNPRPESLLTQPVIGFAAVIIIGGIFSISCGGCTPEKSAIPSAERAIEGHGQALEITTYPRHGDILRDLGRPIVVEFSSRVNPDAFSYRLSPISDGWEETWAPGNRRVVLEHTSSLLPDQTYKLEVSVVPSATALTTFTTEGPSSLELIAREEASGFIDLDTAWIYRMQYVFEADVLPDKYRSTTPVHDVDEVFRDFLQVRTRLEPETIYKLRPYTVRPDHPDSVFARHLQGSRVATSSPARSGWVRAAYANEPPHEDGRDESWSRPASMLPEPCSPRVVVWSAPEEVTAAQEACRQIQKHAMFEDFEKLLGRRPVEDIDACQEAGFDLEEFQKCVEARGGDERLDIYLVPQGYVVKHIASWGGLCFPESAVFGNKATAFILVKLYSNIDIFASLIAHEIFHAFQYAFNVHTDSWWTEATAKWSEEYIERTWNTERHLRKVFDGGLHQQRRLNLKDGTHEYSIYLFPYYLEKIQPGNEQVIADIWAACETDKRALNAIDSVLHGEFDQTLKDFAVANFDLEPYEDKYGQPLPLWEHHGVRKFMLDHDEQQEFTAKEVMDYLSASYQVWTQDLDPNITPLVRFELDDFAGNDKLLLHAIIYTNGDVREEDWSDLDERVFCINQEDRKFDQIALIPVFAERPPEPVEVPTNGGGQNQPTPNLKEVRITVSLETEACRPTMGNGFFKIEINNNWEDLAGRSSFTESVSGQVIFDEYDAGSAQYSGIAKVQFKEHQESHVREEKTLGVDWVKDSYMDKDGRGEVECTLYYPWGEEGATYNFQCGAIEYRGKGREVITYPMKGESEERTWESNGTTDLDVGYIGSYHGGLPARYDLNLNGTHLEDDISPGVNKNHYSSWNFSLQTPSPP